MPRPGQEAQRLRPHPRRADRPGDPQLLGLDQPELRRRRPARRRCRCRRPGPGRPTSSSACAITAGRPLASTTTSAPRPPVSSPRNVARPRSGSTVSAAPSFAAAARRSADGSTTTVRAPMALDGRGDRQPDRAGAEHRHRVARVDAAGPHERVVGDAERLDQRAHRPGQPVRQPVQPGRLGDEELGRGAADREAEVVGADHALADHPVAGREPGHLRPDRRPPRPDHSCPGISG